MEEGKKRFKFKYYSSLNKKRESMSKFLKTLTSINLGIWIIGFLFLQDYYTALDVFNISEGVFKENFVAYIRDWNFVAYMIIIPLFGLLTIFYLSHSIYTLGQPFTGDRMAKKTFFLILLLIFLVFYTNVIDGVIYLYNHYFYKPIKPNFFIEILIFVMIFAFAYRLYESIQNKLPLGCILIFLGIVLFISYKVNGLVNTVLNTWLMFVLFAIHSTYSTFNKEKFKSDLKKNANQLFIFALIFFVIDMKFFNDSKWTEEGLNKTNRTMGMLNKSFLVKNESNITINGNSDSLDIVDKVSKTIPATDEKHEVYYLPISSEMKWYFIDRHNPDINNSKVTIYGVEEKTSTVDPTITVRNVTFRSYFDLNVSK